MNRDIEEDIVIGKYEKNICDKCKKPHKCKRCSKKIHVCSICGKITHECDICGTYLDCISAVRKHQIESKICRKARMLTSTTIEEYMLRFNIVVKPKIHERHRRKSVC
jgi:hypothetical protein